MQDVVIFSTILVLGYLGDTKKGGGNQHQLIFG